jgi:hypothetical protein
MQPYDAQTRKPNFFAVRNNSTTARKNVRDQIMVQHFTGNSEYSTLMKRGGYSRSTTSS